MTEKLEICLFSYVPCVYGDPFKNYAASVNEVTAAMDTDRGKVDACLWFEDEEKAIVTFAMQNVQEVYEHMMAWTERKPEDWFSLHGRYNRHGFYALSFTPKIEKSVDRYRIAYQLANGFPLPQDFKIKIFFKPISFVTSKPSPLAEVVKRNLKKKVEVRFVSTNLASLVREPEELLEQTFKIGEFDLQQGSPEILNEMLSNSRKDYLSSKN